MLFKVVINTDNKSLYVNESGELVAKISNEPNNGLSFNEDNKIKATKGADGSPGIGGTMNLPGNGIEGEVNKGIITIRCNNSVSRKVTSPNDISDCINTHDEIVSKILNG